MAVTDVYQQPDDDVDSNTIQRLTSNNIWPLIGIELTSSHHFSLRYRILFTYLASADQLLSYFTTWNKNFKQRKYFSSGQERPKFL